MTTHITQHTAKHTTTHNIKHVRTRALPCSGVTAALTLAATAAALVDTLPSVVGCALGCSFGDSSAVGGVVAAPLGLGMGPSRGEPAVNTYRLDRCECVLLGSVHTYLTRVYVCGYACLFFSVCVCASVPVVEERRCAHACTNASSRRASVSSASSAAIFYQTLSPKKTPHAHARTHAHTQRTHTTPQGTYVVLLLDDLLCAPKALF